MNQKSVPESTGHIVSWMTRVTLALFLSVLIVIGWASPAASQRRGGQSVAHLSESPFYQAAQTPSPTPVVTPTPTPTLPLTLSSSSFQMTLEELGYDERVLVSPRDVTQYSFRLPDNWLVEPGSYFDLDLSYFYTELGSTQDVLEFSSFGELQVYIDDRLLQVYALSESTLEHVRLRMDLSPELFNERPRVSHQIRVDLSAWFMCNAPHEAQLIIHPESTLFLNYTLLSPTLDLADYPRPFFQRSFESDQVRFALPAQPLETEMRAATVIAAGLGDLTSNRMVISATTDMDWLAIVDTEQIGSEHLFVIGQPGRNQLVTWLNDNVTLPVPIHPRQMALSSRGPTAIMPGDTFSYTITVTNTTPVSATSLSLTDRIPYQVQLLACRPACAEASRHEVSWSLESLSPGEAVSFYLTLRLTDTAQLSSQAPLLENIAILADEAAAPLNLSSLTTAVGPIPIEEESVVSSGQGDYFFVQNGQPVPEGDGILQEIISPWDPQKVILLVTGVNEEAVYKASLALSLATPLPAMEGPTALIREVRPSPSVTATLTTDLTLADLGYAGQTIYGVYNQELVYWFPVPLGWELTDDAYLRLFFSHSEAISEYSSLLTVSLNDTPIATVILDQENATEGSLQVTLPDSNIRHGTGNKISIRASMQLNRDECEAIDINQAWLNVSRDSLLHLDRQVHDISIFDLDFFPFPFDTRSDLSNVLFVLPPTPGLVEQEALLRLAAALGYAAGGPGLSPAVSLGEALDVERLNRYHTIAIGRPTINPLIQQVNSLLPQPFVPGTDEVVHQVGELLLRLPPDTPLGYIQELSSPWNEHLALLAVTGTVDEGVTWANHALVRQPWRLRGNLALVREGGEEIDIQSIDTRSLTSSGLASTMATAVPELTPVAAITPTLQAVTASQDTPVPSMPPPSTAGGEGGLPTWVMLLAGTVAVIVIVIFGAAIWRFRRR